MTHDLIQALRWISRNGAFSAAIVAILALGIGANTAVFGVVDAVLLGPTSFADPERLVEIKAERPNRSRWFRASEYALVEDRGDLFESTAAFHRDLAMLTGPPGPDQVYRVQASAGLFSLLGVGAQLGRTFLESDGADTAVISHRLWQRRYQGAVDVVGRSITIDEKPVVIVGVLEPEFEFPVPNVDIWVPLEAMPPGFALRGVIGRLRDGASIGQVAGALVPIAEQLTREDPQRNADLRLIPLEWRQELDPEYERTLVLTLAAVGVVLLIACANVAGLLLGRAVKREREIAVRISLGAGLWRVARGLLAESALLAALGGIGGALVARAVLKWITLQLGTLPIAIPHLQRVELDGRALAVSIASCVAVAVLCSLAPIAFARRTDPHAVLRSGHRAGARQTRPMFSFLIASQAAFGFLLLVGSALLVKSVLRLQQADKGFETEHLLTMRVPVGTMRGPRPSGLESGGAVVAHYDQMVERIEAIPGVAAAALTSNLPLSGINMTIVDRGPGAKKYGYSLRSVSDSYLSVMGVPLLAGRQFGALDAADSPRVAIINEHMAQQVFPDSDPLGQTLPGGNAENPIRVIGVAKDSWQGHYDREIQNEIYTPYRQLMRWSFASTLVVRTSGDPLALAEAIQQEVWAANPDQPVLKIETMEAVLANAIWRPRFSAWLFSILGTLALALAALGVYAVVAYTSSMRLREVGIRVAVGAAPSDVVSLVLRDALLPMTVGLAAGAAVAFAFSGVLESLLFETPGHDPAAFGVAASCMLAAGVLAGLGPGVAAARLRPASILQGE